MNCYQANSEFGITRTHFWFLHGSMRRGFWRVGTYMPFCRDGYAVMDDFGTLVEVTQ